MTARAGQAVGRVLTFAAHVCAFSPRTYQDLQERRSGPEGIDLTVEQGDFFALLGPNGAGKTTLIGITTSLVTKSAGTVQVFGHDIDRELEAAKSCIGVVPQEINFNMFESPLTIVVNQAGFYGIDRGIARQRAEKYLKQLQLWDKRNSMARGLSGGMKRRLMIARALMHEPKLLILDEPTAGVDIEIRRSMWEFLREINDSGTTIILTTHYLEEAETLCRNIAIIDGGRIAERDRMSSLLRRLNTEVFVLNLRETLNAVPDFSGYPVTLVDPNTLEVEISREQSLNDILHAPDADGDPRREHAQQGQPARGDLHAPGRGQGARRSAGRSRQRLMDALVKTSESPSVNLAKVNWCGFKTIIIREYGRIIRIWGQTLVPPAVQTTLYFTIFGGLIGRRIGQMGGFDYMQFMAPGLIMQAVIQNSYGNVVASFFGAKFGKHIEELLVSPLPNWLIVAGYVAGACCAGYWWVAWSRWWRCCSRTPGAASVHRPRRVLLHLDRVFAGRFHQCAAGQELRPGELDSDVRADPAHLFRRHLLFDPYPAGVGAGGILCKPDHVYGNCLPLRFFGVSDVNVPLAFGITIGLAAILFTAAVMMMNRGNGIRE